jgi:hypothetical protein
MGYQYLNAAVYAGGLFFQQRMEYNAFYHRGNGLAGVFDELSLFVEDLFGS